jgi:integrase
MAKRRGSIFKQVGCNTYTIGYYSNGRRIRKATKSDNFEVAEQQLISCLKKVDEGEAPTIARRRLFVSELWPNLEGHYLRNGRKNCLARRWAHLKPFFGDLLAVNVSYEVIDRYVDKRLKEHASNATVNRELSALKTCFKLALRKQTLRVMPQFPCRLAESKPRSGFVEDADFAKLAANCSGWMRLFLEVAFSLGWRKAEILGLRVGQVDLLERTIRLDPGTTKNGEGREVVMTSAMCMLMAEAIARKTRNDFVFTREDGRHVSNMRSEWQNLCLKAGLGSFVCAKCDLPFAGEKCGECGGTKRCYSGLIVHDLRRSAARQLRKAGVAESTIMAIGGWRTSSVFRRYCIVNNADQRNAMLQLETARAAAEVLRSAEINSHDFSHDLSKNAPLEAMATKGKPI